MGIFKIEMNEESFNKTILSDWPVELEVWTYMLRPNLHMLLINRYKKKIVKGLVNF